MDKRDFIKTLTLGSISWSISSHNIPNWHNENDSEKFWQKVRDDYNLVPDYINLESGYYNIIPKPTLNALHNHIDKVNRLGSMYMRKFKEKEKASINKKLSQIVGCSSKNLILTRNTTESLNSVIKGLNWVEGDNIIFANQDYGAMQQMIHQTAERFKLSTTILDVPNHPKDDDEIVSLYEKSISKSTKLILVSHMVNITGQILPIKKICNMAHNYGVQVLVDGAHCIGHFTFSIDELNCDYYGSSLHKWLAAPLGCGILYINEKHHKDLWPLFTRNSSLEDGIERFGHTGTHPAYHDISISNAIDYYVMLGPKRKEDRLRYLNNLWTKPLRNNNKIILNTPDNPKRYAAIANVGIKGISPSELSNILFEKYKIFCVAIDRPGVRGCRITPNVFTSENEIISFRNALLEIAS